MIIKKSKKNRFFIKNGKIKRYLFSLIYSLIVFFIGVSFHKNPESRYYLSNIKNFFFSPYLYTKNYLKTINSNDIKRLRIDVKFEDFQKLEYDRQVALSINKLVSDSYVPAKIHFNNQIYKIKMRLKGDNVDHLYGDKWSYRVIVKNDKTILGMKQFSLHHPRTRNFIYEWVYHQIMRIENIISLRYDFINLTINGKNLGVYAIEEHFEKRLIENNKRKEGPIVRFNENLMWDEYIQFSNTQNNKNYVTPRYGSYLSSNIDAFQTKKMFNDTIKYQNYIKSQSLLESFRRNNLTTSDVFDLELMSSYFAITELLGSKHGSKWHNIRFYYNPITTKLEPIAFDGNAGKEVIKSLIPIEINNPFNYNNIEMGDGKSYYYNLFKDKKFLKLYISELEKKSTKGYIDSILNLISPELEKKLNLLYREWPTYKFDKNILYKNQSYIREILNPKKSIHSFLVNNQNNSMKIALGNISPLPIEIEYISINDTINSYPQSNIYLNPKSFNQKIDFVNYSFKLPPKIESVDSTYKTIKVYYKINGTNRMNSVDVFPWPYIDQETIENDFIRKKMNIFEFDFFNIDIENKIIKFKKGNWSIYKNIHFPKGYKIIINQGTNLDLLNSSSIFSFSPIHMFGSKKYPISIISSDRSGQGLFILNSKEKSTFNYVNFKNMSNPIKNNWTLTGAITLYNSDININNCDFFDNVSGDDYLNIIQSNFNISNTTFYNVISDAFDSDFSNGIISNCSFINIGNDAIDLSGSEVFIKKVLIKNSSDKAISSGENSFLKGENIKIENSNIALCSKDLSELIISNIKLNNNKIGFAVFQKKSEFGPAYINASNVVMGNISNPYLVEKKSLLEIDGEKIKSTTTDIKALLY